MRSMTGGGATRRDGEGECAARAREGKGGRRGTGFGDVWIRMVQQVFEDSDGVLKRLRKVLKGLFLPFATAAAGASGRLRPGWRRHGPRVRGGPFAQGTSERLVRAVKGVLFMCLSLGR